MTDFAAACYYARHDGTEATPPERDLSTVRAPSLTTVRGAAMWGLVLARAERRTDERPGVPAELAQVTFRHAGLSCAGIAASMVLYGHTAHAETWARAYRLLLDLADRADRARVTWAGGAT